MLNTGELTALQKRCAQALRNSQLSLRRQFLGSVARAPGVLLEGARRMCLERAYSNFLATDDHRFLNIAILAYESMARVDRNRTRWRLFKNVWSIEVKGWLLDKETTSSPEIVVSGGGELVLESNRRFRRQDVEAALENGTLGRIGFANRYSADSFPACLSFSAQFGNTTEIVRVCSPVVRYHRSDIQLVEEQLGWIESDHPAIVDEISVILKRKLSIGRSTKLYRPSWQEIALALTSGEHDGLDPDRPLRHQIHSVPGEFLMNRLRFECSTKDSLLNGFNVRKWDFLDSSNSRAATGGVALPKKFDTNSGNSSSSLGEPEYGVQLKVPKVVSLSNVLVQHGHLIVGEDGVLRVDEDGARPDRDFVAGQWDTVIGSHLRRSECAIRNPEGRQINFKSARFLPCRIPANYFHALVECAPRMVTLQGHMDLESPLLLSDQIPRTVVDAIERVAGDAEIMRFSSDEEVLVSEISIPTSHTAFYDSTVETWWKGAGMYWPVIDEFRNQLIATVQHQHTPNRVFFVRSSDVVNGRGLRNQDELVQIADQFGFVSVDPGKLDLDGQINIMRNAEIIVGPGGASMANLMFGHGDLKVLALVSDHLHDFAMFSTLAHHAGAQYFTLTGPSNRHLGRTEFHRDVFHGDFWISPHKLSAALKFLTR